MYMHTYLYNTIRLTAYWIASLPSMEPFPRTDPILATMLENLIVQTQPT